MTEDERLLLVQVAVAMDRIVGLLSEKFNFDIGDVKEYRALVSRVNKHRLDALGEKANGEQ